MAPPQTHLAWVDLETTGTDEKRDSIIEIGFILTDMELNTVDQGTWVVVPPNPFFLRDMVPFVKEMHEANGLLTALRSDEGLPLSEVEEQMVTMLFRHGITKHSIALAGSGVGHFDAHFVRAQMPEFSKFLAYHVIDVGVIRRFLRDVALIPEVIPTDGDSETKTHRAMDDISQHLSEARHYRSLFNLEIGLPR